MSEPIRRRRRVFGLILGVLSCLTTGCWRLNLQPSTGSDHRLFSVDDPLPEQEIKMAEKDPGPPEALFEEPPHAKPKGKQKYLPEE